MILDYAYNNYSRKLDISYIEDNGAKQILSFNVNRFKSFYSTPTGKYTNWDGSKCDIRWVEKPSKFEIKTFLTELDDKYKSLLNKRTYPKLYTFDIETLADANGEFAQAEVANCPISTISVCSPELNTIVLGTLQLSPSEEKVLTENFTKYMENTAFFKTLGMKMPYVKYVWFRTEEEMLKYFLSNIVAKVPILSGWNIIKYDWNYITNRIKNYFPNLSIKLASCNRRTVPKSYKDRFGNKLTLPIPEHTLLLDMMEVIESEDKTVLPMKESMSLDYIASASMGIHKIEYSGSLDDLYRNDYGKYVFYNSIDSVLVQLINYKFKTLDHIYLYALYCNEKISSCFSKIALTEALVYNDFYAQGYKIVYEERPDVHRSSLIGAYVKKPVPGIHQFVCCNDFASLYPSTIRTCNLSFENYIGAFWDEESLQPYRDNRAKYVVIGPNVFRNEGSADKPQTGRQIGTFLDEKSLAKYRADNHKYFVSVNGVVYKNDKDYSFRRIQAQLKAARDHDKYLGKSLDASAMYDVGRIERNESVKKGDYHQDVIEKLHEMGYDIKNGNDIMKFSPDELKDFKRVLQNEIVYLDTNQLAMKLLMNSMYGGASHISFYWYNMNVANDITGESRNLIHMMEHHIPDYIAKNWMTMTDVHKELGIEVDQEKAKQVLKDAYYVPENIDPDTYNHPSFVLPVYGDSVDGQSVISLVSGDKTIEKLFNESDIYLVDRDKEFAISNETIVNYDGKNFVYNKIKNVIRHKVTKQKWVLTTEKNSVYVTSDHSLILYKNGKLEKTKPCNVKSGMLVVTTCGITKVVNCENCGLFEDEYVYDISVDTNNENMQNFFANGILVHNTDSVDGNTIIHTDNGDKTIAELYNENCKNIFLTQKGHELVSSDAKVLNYDDNGKLKMCGINYIMRHKVNKPKWRLKTKSGKEVIVTNDHSMIVFRDGKKLEVKPYEIRKTDKILVLK